MSVQPKVYLDVLPWDCRSRNMDWRYVRQSLPQLPHYQPGLSLMLQSSPRITLRGNLKTIRMAIGRRIGLPLTMWSRETSMLDASELQRSGANIVFSHREFPLNAGATPVIWMSAILDPAMSRHYGVKQSEMDAELETKGELFRRAAAVQVSTHAEARRHAAMFPAIADRFIGVPFFTPHIEACDAELLERHRNAQPVRILFVGNHARRKGLRELVAAFQDLPEAVQRNARLSIISNFDRGKVELPANDRIHLIGAATGEQVLAEMRRAHILVNVAHFESYGFVFLEAMSQGVACIAPDWEVQRELFDEGRAGALVPCRSEALKAALTRMIEDHDDRHARALAGWNRYRQHYAPEIVARRYAALFASVANG